MFFTSTDHVIAESFVKLTSRGEYPNAHGMLHRTLQQEMPLAEFAEVLTGAQHYTKVSCYNISASGPNTTLSGFATIASDCSSRVSMEPLGGQIIAFEISSLCRE